MTTLQSSSTQSTIGVLWDIDGTLANSFQLGYASTNEVLKRHGKDAINEAQYHEGTKYTTPTRLAWHVTGDPSHSIGIQLGEEFDELYTELVSTDTAALYDGIKDLLVELKMKPAINYGALSNAGTAYVKAVLKVNDLDGLFSVGLGADSVVAPKPAGDGLLQLCDEMGLQPDRCIYIGDSPTDGQAARAAGMKSIGVTWGSYSKERLAANFDTTVDSVPQLRESVLGFVASVANV